MDMLDTFTSNEHSETSAPNTIGEKLLKDEYLYLDNELQPKELRVNLHNQDYIEKMKEFQFYLEMVKQIAKPGCSQEVLNVAVTSMSSLVKMLSVMSAGPYPLASL